MITCRETRAGSRIKLTRVGTLDVVGGRPVFSWTTYYAQEQSQYSIPFSKSKQYTCDSAIPGGRRSYGVNFREMHPKGCEFGLKAGLGI